jgi:polysaccharide pyruvyl transferase WcaK-like protein
MTLRHLAAGDRNNYGDLLFALIFNHYFESSFTVKYYGIVKSDLSDFGAFPTSSYKELLSDIDYKSDYIIIGGGEVLTSYWSTLYAFINPVYNFLMKNKYLSRLEVELNVSGFILQGYSSENKFPWIPNNCKAIYLAAGGGISKYLCDQKLTYVKRNLSEAKFLSVRDKRTKNSLALHDISSDLIPDTAILMSKVFPIDKLENEIKNQDILGINGDYLFLQVSVNKGPTDLVAFQKNINSIAGKKNLKVVCCPIGLALGHEDHIILKKLCSTDSSWIYVEPSNLFEIMSLIANSSLYIGTSLHGLITAFSYLVPTFLINDILVKVNSFVDTWCKDFYKGAVAYDEISSKVDEVLNFWDKSKAEVALINCQNLVEDYFKKLEHSVKE